ncbi:MAG TPA: acyl-CoA dehydrogenase family protein [Syntrophales bacterium]|nr:acyl-CoA dehydrogenase family protein [Syntrophales bacterium]HOM07186.1 acyl-CoA dehydrogenase family protein [Syntrophales bacterium]HOO00228.1 acyl-CoA dehydrogenase family protein [Syntrophales bacterium]HPQ06735.1 acyl-CoA dehydrogenase family protein [Syntrophales bacterium]HRS87235.1 acyl-CoA dehydrogenase family protein [Syntrophales bacterium]
MNFALTEEQQMVKDQVTRFAETEIKPIAAELDRTHRHPEEICRKLGQMGIMGVAIPTEYGGAGMDTVTYVHCMIAISKACASTGVIVSVNNSLYGFPLNTYGTHEQKLKYLVPVASGQVEGCYALTEANAGSDAASLACRAVLKGDKYIVNGVKRFITNGNVARYCVLAATEDPAKGYKGVLNLVVDLKNTPGFSIGKIEEKLGILASGTAELVFEDAEVPAENLLGKPGQGFRQMLSGLDAGRIGIGSQACGIGKAALEDALNYAKERVQFGKPISTFQAIQFKLADMATELDAAELLLLRAAWMEDNHMDYEKESAMAKMYASDVAMKAAIECVQIFGGYGYCKEYPAERHMRDAKICQIYEGTNEIQRVVIARKLLSLR